MDDIKVGQIIAKEGSYNRKYKVVKVTPLGEAPEYGDYKQWVVELQPLGHWYQDGRVKLPRKSSPNREILTWGHDTPYLYHYVVDSGNIYKP